MRTDNMRVMTLLLPAVLVLAACGGKEEAGNNGADADVPPAAAQEQTDINLTIDPQNSVVPLALPSPTPLAALPPAYAGRWGSTAGDCDTARGSPGLLAITGDTLTFARSRGKVSAVAAASPGRITAAIEFTDGSRHWRRATALTLIDGGRTLIREESDPAASIRYSRCPATEEKPR